ncbi:SOS response-associated peptidase [Phaeacidiphilus oryzae]|jgi:putative SOS response-associated peptidase YedK|uniref:SOS response-associated peptidase n=1 Tax=Phaeacidiphilus oryzae TaxID=348818 RepID=UPI00056A014B|nr:SOS response-associated peptidase [Phaeacidiphilus oryzae]
MCGRYASSRKPEDLVELFEVERWDSAETYAPDYNIAPTKQVPAILERPVKEEGGAVRRQLRLLRWGLVPSWSKSPDTGVKMINARAETVHEKPSYRRAFASRRCLLPADGYYEWMTDETASADGKGKKAKKQPYFISPADGSVMAMAGLFEFWRDRTRPDDDPAAWWATCTVITTEAEDELGRIHPRMPLVMRPGSWDRWLDPSVDDVDELRSLLVPPQPGQMAMWPVSTEVNSVRNNGPELERRIGEDLGPEGATLF